MQAKIVLIMESKQEQTKSQPTESENKQCYYCGYEPTGKVPKKCPKCGGSSWERRDSGDLYY